MLREEFTGDAPGRLLEIPDGIAFFPNPLPPKEILIEMDLLTAYGEAEYALGRYVGEARRVKNRRLVMHPLALIESVESNKIEGTHTLIAEVLLQRAGRLPRNMEQRGRQAEVLAYLEALELGESRLEEGWPLGAQLIRSLHQVLMSGTRGGHVRTGAYRLKQVYLGGFHPVEAPAEKSLNEDDRRTTKFAYPGKANVRERLRAAAFVPPPPEQVPPAMEDFFRFLSGPAAFNSLIDCALQHYQFEAIHPFEDGNGRLGRLLITLFLLTKGVLTRPDLYLSEYLESHRDQYISLLKGVSLRGDWKDWIIFFLKAIKEQANSSLERVRRVLELIEKYERVVLDETRSQAALAAIEVVMTNVYVGVGDVAKHANCSRPTARHALETLERLNILNPMSTGEAAEYRKLWVAQELLDHVYEL